MAPFAPPQPIRAFPWDHSVSYFIHLISTLKTDYKQFPQNHSWLTVLPFIFADGLPIILFLRFSWLQPTQSGHLERIHLISQATCHRLTGADSSSIQSSRPNYSSLAASLQEAISQNLLRYQFPWFALPFNGTLLSLSSSSTIAFKTFANLHIPLKDKTADLFHEQQNAYQNAYRDPCFAYSAMVNSLSFTKNSYRCIFIPRWFVIVFSA